MTLLDRYTTAVQRGDIQDDAAQRDVLPFLQTIVDAIDKPSMWYRWRRSALKGLYLVGPVGSGKTYLMDLFYQSLSKTGKMRVHFLSWMQQLDQQLRQRQGQANPVQAIAADMAKIYRVICIDEFIVADLAQAMILTELLPILFAARVVLVATSNTKMEDLYLNGVNRDYFLPTIRQMQQQCAECQLNTGIDYRVGRPPEVNAYLYPLSACNQQCFSEQFSMLAHGANPSIDAICIQNRMISVEKVAASIVWFEFAVICNSPRCQFDYIEIAQRYSSVCVANVPILSQLKQTTSVVLFIQFVDILYDRGVRLLISAAVKASDLYIEGPMLSEFARTLSRLEEMQSTDYLARRCNLVND